MKDKTVILDLLAGSAKDIERVLGIKIVNGQGLKAVKTALAWVLK